MSICSMRLPQIERKLRQRAAGAEFSWTDDVLLYGQFASGARNGNINSTATLGSMELFAPGSSEGLAAYGNATFSHTGSYINGLGGSSTVQVGNFTVFGMGVGLRARKWSLDLR